MQGYGASLGLRVFWAFEAFQGLGFRVWVFGAFQGLGFRGRFRMLYNVSGFGFRVQGYGSWFPACGTLES